MFKCAVARLCPLYAKQAIFAHFTLHYKHTNWEHKIPGYTRSLPRIIVAHYHAVSARISRSLYPSYPKPSKPYGISAPLRFYRIGGIFH